MVKLHKCISNLLLYLLILFIPCILMFFIAPINNFVNFSDTKNVIFCIAMYFLIFFVLFYVCYKKDKNKLLLFGVFLFLNLIIRFSNMDIRSGDYNNFLSHWVDSYRNLSLFECFTTKISNYSPPYNYFLILFSRIPLSDLYLIKFLSFTFEILTAYYVTKLIAFLKKENFNKWIFLIILSIPMFLINSVEWAQCDSIYAFFCFMAIYCAIKHYSKSSFLFFGLSLSFKFQSVILFPVALVLLLCRDDKGSFIKWRDLWIGPVIYIFITGVSMFFGKSFEDAFLIYFEQSVTYNELSSSCLNLPFLFNWANDMYILKNVLMIIFITITFIVVFFILFKYLKKKLLISYEIVNLSFLITFFIVFFMPKMLDRYYYLSCVFAVVLLFVTNVGVYKKMLIIVVINSSVAHFGATAYYNNVHINLVVYSYYFLFYIACLYNCLCAFIIGYKVKEFSDLDVEMIK